MKKHFWRILTVLLMACLGIGILAACGDGTEPENPDNPENPAVTDPIEGVWTGATATGLFGSRTANDTFTATVDLIEGQAHAGYVVVKATEGEDDYYFAFGIDKDGENYKGSMSVGSETPVSITVSLADNKLTAVVPFGEEPTTLTFTSRNATLPAAIAPTGTLYAEVNSHVTYKIDFTAKKLYAKMGSGSYTEQNVKFINVGDYIGIEPTGEGTEGAGLVPVFKSGSDYYIFVVAAGEAPIKLTANEPTPAPATTYTVQFELGDHGTTTEEVTNEATEGETLTSEDFPDVTAKKGYTFTGWKIGTKDVTTSYEVDPTDAVGTTITLTAQYDYIEYAIEYVKGEVAGDPSSMPQNPTEKVSLENGHNKFTLPTAEPTLTDQVFDGWKLGTRDLGKTNTEITITVNDLPDNPADPTQAKLTITAQWHPDDKIVVTYELGEHHALDATLPKQSDTVDKNGTLTLPTDTATLKGETGYEFDGWYIEDEKLGETKQVREDNITIIAQFKLIEFTIIFAKGDDVEADGTINNVTGITLTNKDVALSDKTYTRSGYALTGWKFDNSHTYAVDGTFELTTDIIETNGGNDHKEITLTAQWTKEYTLKFYKGEAESSADYTIKVLKGTNVMGDSDFETVQGPDVEANQHFDGWYYEKDGQQYLLDANTKPEDMVADGGNEIKLHAKVSMRFTATTYTGDTPLYTHEGGLQKGSAITFSGDLTFTNGANTNVYDGVLGYLSQGDGITGGTKKYIIARYDWHFNNTSATKVGEKGDEDNQDAMPELKWTLTKYGPVFSKLTIGAWYEAFLALIKRADTTFKFELEYDYTTEGAVFISYVLINPTEFTYTYGEGGAQSQTVPAGSQFIMRYVVTASEGQLADNLVVAIGGQDATLANVTISEVKNSHIHTGEGTCDICSKTLVKSDEKDFTLQNNDVSQDWKQHIAGQVAEYTAAPGRDLHVRGTFGVVGEKWNGFATVISEKTSHEGMFFQYQGGACRIHNDWTSFEGSPWNLEKRVVNGNVAGDLDALSAETKDNHCFELILTYDGERAKLTIITYSDEWQKAADTRVITFNIKGEELQLAIGLDAGGTNENVKNVKYYTITAQDAD